MPKNEFGADLDINGYAPSILQWNTGEQCAFCKADGIDLVRHEIYQGPNRTNSKKYGLWISVCPTCHRFIHQNPQHPEVKDLDVQAEHQAMEKYGWDKAHFIMRFGKNYI